MTAILEVTDGTTTISLLNGEFGYYCSEWRPSIIVSKGGGIWQSSPLSDGRNLVAHQWNNVIETFELKATDVNADSISRRLQELRALLNQANDYWTANWQTAPVYLKTQASCETNPRYATIHAWRTPEDGNPFAQPFLQPAGAVVLDDWVLIIERGHWLENAPGTGTAITLSAVETYDSRSLGNVDSSGTRSPTSANEVYITGKRNEANLTHIFVEDGGVFGPNLMDAALPYALFPAVPAQLVDFVYFGIDTTVANSGPFNSLVFDIGTAQNDLTLVWQYRGAAGFNNLTVTDNTAAAQAFDTTGVNSVHWIPESTWTAAAINGVTAYWVRVRISGVGAAPSPPTQQNRDVYSIVWPYTELQNNQTGGTLPSLARIKVYNQAGDPSGPPPVRSYINRAIVGLRSLSRGSNFTAYLNLADEQNPTGVTISIYAPWSAFASDIEAPSGRYVLFTPTAPILNNWRPVATITLSTSLTDEYTGTYRAFLRTQQSGGSAGDISYRLNIQTTDYGFQTISSADTPVSLNDWQLLDFGKVTIVTTDMASGDGTDGLQIDVEANASSTTPNALLYDVILIPVDEWVGDFLDTIDAHLQTGVWNGDYLDADSITSPKFQRRSHVRETATDRISSRFRRVSNGLTIMQSSGAQRYWFLLGRNESIVSPDWRFEPWSAASLQIERCKRYFSYRGDQ